MQTIIQKYKTLLTTESLPRSAGRKRKLTVADERLVVRKVRVNTKLTTKEILLTICNIANYLEASDLTFWKHVLWSDETKIELFEHNDQRVIISAF